MPDVSGPEGSPHTARPRLPLTAGLDGVAGVSAIVGAVAILPVKRVR